MAVSVVATYAGAQPDHVLDSKIIREDLFVISAFHLRIALLDFAKQALLGREQRALTVNVNGSAFQDNALLAEDRT